MSAEAVLGGLLYPSDSTHSVLAVADSYEDFCASQTQVLKEFHWRPDRQKFSVEIATTAFKRISTEPGCAQYLKWRPASVRLTFAVTPEGLCKAAAVPRGPFPAPQPGTERSSCRSPARRTPPAIPAAPGTFLRVAIHPASEDLGNSTQAISLK